MVMEKDSRVELLAPAGSPAAFYGAVNAGADAIYLGGNRFGARAYAENFTQEELLACIRYGRLFGVKIYLTVNTLLKERELAELPDYLAPFYRAGLDAVIVQDFGVLRVIREIFPDLAIHGSTQMTICNVHGSRLLKEMGAKRVVPARELSLRELTGIKMQCDIELETFVHGAMCYCYSGQCLFSSILGGRSGNRGRCAQPCRLPYGVRFEGIPGEKGKSVSGGRREPFYPLSLKDMCTIEHIPSLIEAGIDSFKIEGRMKKPEYAAGVTAVYRKYIDRYHNLRDELGEEGARKAYRVEPEDIRMLSSLYIRSQVQDGYYFRRNGREMVTLDDPAYCTTNETLLEEIRRVYLSDRKRFEVEIEAHFLTGQPARVILRRSGVTGEAVGETVETALRQPITEEDLKKQLGKLGDTPFKAGEMKLKVSSDAFYPLKQINGLRREAALSLEKSLLGADTGRLKQSMFFLPAATNRPNESTRSRGGGWAVSVRTLQQLEKLVAFFEKCSDVLLQRVYVDGDLLSHSSKGVLQFCNRIRELSSCQTFIVLPYIVRQSDEEYLQKLMKHAEADRFDGFLVRSLDGLGFFRNREGYGILRGDAAFYTWNSQSVLQLSEELDGFCIPFELTAAEQERLTRDSFSWEKIVYGRIPMMVTANCVLKTTEGCSRETGGCIQLIDRYKKSFPVLRDCTHCTNIIYNSVPLSLHGRASALRERCVFRIDFTLETARETESVLGTFWKGWEFAGQYTTGHEKRGVE